MNQDESDQMLSRGFKDQIYDVYRYPPPELQIERRIYYDEVEGLIVECLDATSTLVLSPSTNKGFNKRGSPGKCRALDEVALIVNTCELNQELDVCELRDKGNTMSLPNGDIPRAGNSSVKKVEPAVFPMTVRLLQQFWLLFMQMELGMDPLKLE